MFLVVVLSDKARVKLNGLARLDASNCVGLTNQFFISACVLGGVGVSTRHGFKTMIGNLMDNRNAIGKVRSEF